MRLDLQVRSYMAIGLVFMGGLGTNQHYVDGAQSTFSPAIFCQCTQDSYPGRLQ
jgi:hypothetical protein